MLLTFVDIETTGFNTYKDVILEVGYLRVNVIPKPQSTKVDMNIVGSGNLYFFKDGWDSEANADAFEKHRLSNEFMSQFNDQEVFDRNISALYTLMYNSYFVGKNSDKFDLPMITNFINKHTVFLEPIVLAGSTIDVEKVLLESYREYYKKKTGQETRRRGTLEDYMDMIGYTESDIMGIYKTLNVMEGRGHAHAGLYDALMTYLAFKYTVEKLHMTFQL